jgi:hypothetical protein
MILDGTEEDFNTSYKKLVNKNYAYRYTDRQKPPAAEQSSIAEQEPPAAA